MSRRIILVIADDLDAAEMLSTVLRISVPGREPWVPNDGSKPFGSPQDRYTREDTDRAILAELHEHAHKLHIASNAVIEDPS